MGFIIGSVTQGQAATTQHAKIVDERLAHAYPHPKCDLDFTNSFELLVATILSAQCTDERVNAVTPLLFARWPHPQELAAADMDEVATVIRPLGMHQRKAQALVTMAQALVDSGGEVPAERAALEALPGVGRKTANVVLGNAFSIPALPVDTHVLRVCARLGLTCGKNARAVEDVLCDLLPEESWVDFSHRVIWHGRTVCHARQAACGACVLQDVCPRVEVAGVEDPQDAWELVKGQHAEGYRAQCCDHQNEDTV